MCQPRSEPRRISDAVSQTLAVPRFAVRASAVQSEMYDILMEGWLKYAPTCAALSV